MRMGIARAAATCAKNRLLFEPDDHAIERSRGQASFDPAQLSSGTQSVKRQNLVSEQIAGSERGGHRDWP